MLFFIIISYLIYTAQKNKVNIHIKFNTGMNRYGFDSKETKK